MRLRLPMLFLLALLGCEEEFLPVTLLEEARVLALVADPLEVTMNEAVRVQPHLFVPEGAEAPAVRWSVCPLSLGPFAAYRCVDDACLTELVPAEDESVTLVPSELALACFSALASGGDGPPEGVGPAPAMTPAALDTVVFYELTGLDTPQPTTLLRIPLWLGSAPAERNQAPRVERFVSVETTFTPGGDVALELDIDPDSVDGFVDPRGAATEEEPIVSWFATAGRLESERTAGMRHENIWRHEKIEGEVTQVQIYGVVRDGRGGQAVAGPLTLKPDQ